MVISLPTNLQQSFDLLIESILESREYQTYFDLKRKMLKHPEIQELISSIKELQKKLVQMEYHHKDITDIEKQYHDKVLQLESYPLYHEFEEAQRVMNEILQSVKSEVERVFDDIVLNS